MPGEESVSSAQPSMLMNGITPSKLSNQAPPIIADVDTPGTPMSSSGGTGSKQSAKEKRIEVDVMMAEFQKSLGENWDRYRQVITHFLIGRLTRVELQDELDQILSRRLIHMHNQFLLSNLANALRDAPQGEGGLLSGWSKRHKDSSRNVKGDSQLVKLKEDIMGLSVRERKRIKAIARESGKKAPMPSTVTATRQALLPKIPFVNDKDRQHSSSSVSSSSTSAAQTSTQSANQSHNRASENSDPLHGSKLIRILFTPRFTLTN